MKTNLFSSLLLVFLIFGSFCVNSELYQPTWESLDTRPLPEWFDKAKIGIFIHWGVFSVPSMGTEWVWTFWNDGDEVTKYIQDNFPPGFSYQEFAKDFTAEFFNASEWAQLFARSGAKYVVLTSKHHEGFTMWPSSYSYSWNAKDIGPHRDIVGDLAEAVRAQNLTYGLYHSLLEWYHPLYLKAKATNFENREFAVQKAMPELYELVNNYEPSIIWSDGAWENPDTYWNATDFIAWLYNESPVKDFVVTNDRWGQDVTCKHGGYYTCNDRYLPDELQEKKWENAMSLDRYSFGYRRNANYEDYLSFDELVTTVIQTVAYGGNILINIGPGHDGTINMIFQERLLELGDWLSINGEAIYESSPWTVAQKDNLTQNVYYTIRNGNYYASFLKWPVNDEIGILYLGSVSEIFNANTTVSLLGLNGNLFWTKDNNIVKITLPNLALITTKSAWVIKIENAQKK
ncbi:tissue alpha-L-fucosidase-like [Rhynchophorus ferrugineus]|uniref:tissue alpha-L-fucosidase-like n=1 Tax=Rhynchophorus ferrugineus TaxID=354439 RepID=UPI003FCDF077